MNGFQVKSIDPWEKTAKKAHHWMKGHIVLSIVALVLGVLTLKGVVGAIQLGEPFSVKQIVISAIGNGLKSDNYGHTNILLLGVGGEGHDGGTLTDTMMVASIDQKNKMVPILSIPRDLYVENDLLGWGTRLNSIVEFVTEETGDPEQGIEELTKEIEDILDIEIHYYAKIDFQGFTEVVDALGGIDVYVDKDIYDATYPAPTDSSFLYDPFVLAAGPQRLDGETALKYARSRHTTSDFDRARRQQQIMTAVKDQATSLGVLLSPEKIKDTYSAISQNFESNLSLTELLTLTGMADDFSSEQIVTEVLNDEANKTGGFLYTPDREEYGGAFVLVPYSGDFAEIQTFAQLFFYHPEIYKAKVPIQILNGTTEASLAGLTKMYLVRYGFNIVDYGNAATKNVKDTSLFSVSVTEDKQNTEQTESTLELLPSLTFGEILSEVPVAYLPQNWPTDAQIILELGEDFVDFYKEHGERFYLGFY